MIRLKGFLKSISAAKNKATDPEMKAPTAIEVHPSELTAKDFERTSFRSATVSQVETPQNRSRIVEHYTYSNSMFRNTPRDFDRHDDRYSICHDCGHLTPSLSVTDIDMYGTRKDKISCEMNDGCGDSDSYSDFCAMGFGK